MQQQWCTVGQGWSVLRENMPARVNTFNHTSANPKYTQHFITGTLKPLARILCDKEIAERALGVQFIYSVIDVLCDLGQVSWCLCASVPHLLNGVDGPTLPHSSCCEDKYMQECELLRQCGSGSHIII